MRKIVQVPRVDDESWVEYVRRATHVAEQRCADLGHEAWDGRQRALKRNFAIKLTAGNTEKWSTKLIKWEPWFRSASWRRVGRPCKRWSDDLTE